MAGEPLQGFLLTRHWRDSHDGIELEYWWATDSGPLRSTVHGERAVFFLREADLDLAGPILQQERSAQVRSVKLQAFDMTPVRAIYFPSYRQARQVAGRLREGGCDPLEADINPAERDLMERARAENAVVVVEVTPYFDEASGDE